MAARKKAAAQPAKKKRARRKYELEVAVDVQRDLEEICRILPDDFPHVDPQRVVCFRSVGATARIYARIWSLPKIWQMALGVPAHYAVEVVEAYDKQSPDDRLRTLIHELMHIPKTFSGNLVPHKCFGKNIDCNSVEVFFEKYKARKAAEARPAPAPAPVPAAPPRPLPAPSRRERPSAAAKPRAPPPVAVAEGPMQLTLDPF